MKEKLVNLGFREKIIQEIYEKEGFPARITGQYQGLYRVSTAESDFLAEIKGVLRYGQESNLNYPVVGDFVALDRENDINGRAIIKEIMPRTSIFRRRAAGSDKQLQAVAANIDKVFICMALNNDFNLRRLERYLALAWESGALPVIVLTKADLCLNLEERKRELSEIALGVEILISNALEDEGYEQVKNKLRLGQTIAFIGSSGVGKSTLINRLLGRDIIQTAQIRADDRGRHTTTSRELHLLEGLGSLIDTPGMRELGVDYADIDKAFAEIENLAEKCRFRDCSHRQEPGCAVKIAVEKGTLSQDRYESYLKLKKEAGYEGLDSRQIEKEKIEQMFKGFGGIKNARKFIKNKK